MMQRNFLAGAFALLTACSVNSVLFAQLVVTEVMYNPVDDNVWEWIEVKNTGTEEVDLAGYYSFKLGREDFTPNGPAIDPAFAMNTKIGGGQTAVIYDANYGSGNSPFGNPNNFVDDNFRSAWGLNSSVPLIGANFFPALSNNNPSAEDLALGINGKSIGFWQTTDAWRMDQTDVELDPVGNPGVLSKITTSFDHAGFSIDYYGNGTFPTANGSSITWTGAGSNTNGANWVTSTPGDGTGTTTSVLVEVPGFINDTNDSGNPGLVPPGTVGFASPLGLTITEVMYDPASTPDNDWEWVELYNSSGSDIDVSGWVLDDGNGNAHSAANIAAGTIPAGGTGIFYGDVHTDEQFRAAWETSSNTPLNLIPVSGWTSNLMALNSDGDDIGFWTSFANYSGDHQTKNNVEVSLNFDEGADFPTGSNGPSISLRNLALDPSLGDNWENAVDGDLTGSFNANGVAGSGGLIPLHAGGDIASPGTFNVIGSTTPGDFNGDGKVDGTDFLEWQRGNSPNPFSTDDLNEWQTNYGTPVVAAVGAVPEPASLLLLGLAVLPLAVRRS